MNANFKNNLELILSLAALIGIIYKIAQLERAIYVSIDNIKDNLSDRLFTEQKRLDLLMQSTESKNEMIEYRLEALDQKINHKFHRLLNGQQDIQKYLEKTGSFQIRNYYTQRETQE